MGYMQAQSFADAVEDGDISLEAALRYHLECNHYPPVGFLYGAAWDAIQACREDDFDREIAMPDGVTFRATGDGFGPAGAVAAALHLEPFI